MLNGPRTLPNTFTTASTTAWCSAGTSDLPVIGATRGMMGSFLEIAVGSAASLHARELELGGAVAADEMGGRDLSPCRRLGPAHLDRVRAARVEIAAARGRGGIRHLALQHDAPRACAWIRLGSGGQERRRVGGLGSRGELFGLRQLHDAPD